MAWVLVFSSLWIVGAGGGELGERRTMRSARKLLLLIACLVLVSCGGGDGAGTGTSPALTGVLVDSPVQGLPYSSSPSGLSGRTGLNGEFQYRSGDEVTFTVGSGGHVLRAEGQPFITPFVLAGNSLIPNTNQPGPVNLARYLLMLDTTPGAEVLTMPATLPTLPNFTCFTCSGFEAFMANGGVPLTVTEADAIAHLKGQFAIWGSWATSTSPGEARVFTFLSDGTYLLADDDNPAVAGGTDGMEKGSYLWNPVTSVFTYNVTVNTDGTGGISSPSPAQVPPYTFVIDASGNSAVLHLGPNPIDEIHLSRVASPGSVIVGGWKLSSLLVPGFYAVITFMADGTFMVASDAVETIPAGVERGTYVFDAVTGNLTLTTTVDTNGEFGFNDATTLPAVTANTIQITFVFGADDYMRLDDGGPDVVYFDRVRAP